MHPGRFISTIIGIAISVAFLAGSSANTSAVGATSCSRALGCSADGVGCGLGGAAECIAALGSRFSNTLVMVASRSFCLV